MQTEIDRLMTRVEMVPEAGCWIWMGSANPSGYGMLRDLRRRKSALAHRLAWETWRGPIPAGLYVCHHCDVPPCINPAHLFLGTHRDNMIDAGRKGRNSMQQRPENSFFATAAGKRLRARGEAHGRAILTADDVVAIRQRCGTGESDGSIARDYGVTKDAVLHVRKHYTWKHIP